MGEGILTCRRLWFPGVGTRPKTCWPIESASSAAETICAKTVADTIVDTGIVRSKLGKGSEEALGKAGVLI